MSIIIEEKRNYSHFFNLNNFYFNTKTGLSHNDDDATCVLENLTLLMITDTTVI